MYKFLITILACVLFTACRAQRSVKELAEDPINDLVILGKIEHTYIYRFYDTDIGAICYMAYSGYSGGISCLIAPKNKAQ